MGFLQFGSIWNSERLRYKAQPQVKTGADVLPLHRQKRALVQPVWMDGGSTFLFGEMVQGLQSRSIGQSDSAITQLGEMLPASPSSKLSYKDVHSCIHSYRTKRFHFTST